MQDPPAPPKLLVVGRLGTRTVAFPADAVERILRMVALTALPGAPPGLAGVVDVHGEPVPVVDPRPRLGLPTPVPHPNQHLALVAAPSRFALWLDHVERIAGPGPDDLRAVEGEAAAVAPLLARLDEGLVPVLSLEALDPGPLASAVRSAAGPTAA